MHRSAEDIAFAAAELEKLHASFQVPLETLETLYLGPAEDVQTLRDDLQQLKTAQSDFLEYATDSNVVAAGIEAYEKKYLDALYSEALGGAEHITAVAQEKKVGYGETAESLRKSMLNGSMFLMALMIATLLISQFVLFKQRRELLYRSNLFDGLSKSIDDAFMIRDAETDEIQYYSLNMERILGTVPDVGNVYQGMKPEDAAIFK